MSNTVVSVANSAWDIWKSVRAHYVAIAISVAVSVVAVTVFALMKGPLYSSSMTVKAAEQPPAGALSSALKKLPISLGSLASGDDLLSSYVQLLQSAEVAKLLISRDHFDRILFTDRIDPQTGKWTPSFVRSAKSALNTAFGVETLDRPTVEDVQKRLIQMIAVNQDQLTNLVTVDCSSHRQDLCRQLLLAVHKEAEYRLAQIQHEQAIAARDYILANIDYVTQTESKQYLLDTLTDTNNQIAMAGLNRPVAAVIVDPPQTPTQPSFPKPFLLLLVAVGFGLTIGIGIAWLADNRPSFAAA